MGRKLKKEYRNPTIISIGELPTEFYEQYLNKMEGKMDNIDWDRMREINDRKYRDSYNYDGRYDEEDGEEELDDLFDSYEDDEEDEND